MERLENPGTRLEQQREQAIDSVTRCYTEDYLDTQEFEDKLEEINQATSIRRLEQAMADLPGEYRVPAAGATRSVATPQSFTTIMSDRRYGGELVEAGQATCFTLMGDTVFDLREVPVPPGDLYLNITCVMGDVKIYLPPSVRIDNQIHTIMADMKVKGHASPDSQCRLNLTGYAIMADIKIRYA